MRLVKNQIINFDILYCLKVANNATNNYRLCQSLFNSIQLLLINTTKEPKWTLNNKCHLTNNFIRVKKKRNYLDCKWILNIEVTSRRAFSKHCPLFINNMRFAIWDLWKRYLFEIYDTIDDKNTSLQLSNSIINSDKDLLEKDIHDLILFYSVEKDNLNLVRCNCIVILYCYY